jgi:hypothetical protein
VLPSTPLTLEQKSDNNLADMIAATYLPLIARCLWRSSDAVLKLMSQLAATSGAEHASIIVIIRPILQGWLDEPILRRMTPLQRRQTCLAVANSLNTTEPDILKCIPLMLQACILSNKDKCKRMTIIINRHHSTS